MKFFSVEPEDRKWAIDHMDFKEAFNHVYIDCDPEQFSRLAVETIDASITAEAQYRAFKRDIAKAMSVGVGFNIGFNVADARQHKEAYIETAQMLQDVILSRKPDAIYAGISASAYLKLCQLFYPNPEIRPCGIYKDGFLGGKEDEGGVPLYKAPSRVCATHLIYLDCLSSIGKIVCIEINGLKGIIVGR